MYYNVSSWWIDIFELNKERYYKNYYINKSIRLTMLRGHSLKMYHLDESNVYTDYNETLSAYFTWAYSIFQ